VTSSLASGFDEGKNQKYSSEVSFFLSLIGKRPAYDSPMSKLTSGMAPAVPFTANSSLVLALTLIPADKRHTLSRRSRDDGCGFIHRVLALDVLDIVRRASKLWPGKVKLLANRLSRIAGSNAARKATNDQKRCDELHFGCSKNLVQKLLETKSPGACDFKYDLGSGHPRRHFGTCLLQRDSYL
jgi:hypothetical protein